MADIRKLLAKLAEEERSLLKTEFMAPCVPGGKVRTRVSGLVYTFRPSPPDFEGFGIFLPEDEKTASLAGEADLPMVARYLSRLEPLRVRLCAPLRNKSWLAYPSNESDALQRLGAARPLLVHLVSEAGRFDQVVARADGAAFWFEEQDRRDDPRIAEKLREELARLCPPEELRAPGLTPEMRAAYELALQQSREFILATQHRRDEDRLKKALSLSGASLQNFQDRGEIWLVEWSTRDGQRHTSAVSKQDLTVVSSGICLSGRDRDFDLQSLVTVIEQS